MPDEVGFSPLEMTLTDKRAGRERRIVALVVATLLAATRALPWPAGRNIFIAGSSAVHRRLLSCIGSLTG